MQFEHFIIQNFKGIKHLSFGIKSRVGSDIFTMIGLNESGKTTILEALSFFYQRLKNNDELSLYTVDVNDVHKLIPKSKKGNFNDCVYISGEATLNEEDINRLRAHLSADIGYTAKSIDPRVSIGVRINFENSRYKSGTRLYTIHMNGREKDKKRSSDLVAYSPGWHSAVSWLHKNCQPIIYYPNFLFDFPDRIYLEESKNESIEEAFYRKFFQDVLDSFDDDLSINTHIIDRIKSNTPQDKESLEAVINKVGTKITRLVFNKEFSVFKSDFSRNSIAIGSPELDTEKGAHFVEIKLKDGDESYYVRERSLGFRWFITFLLLTQFRISRLGGKRPVFLFDEPASNLHQTAQQRLRIALKQLTDNSAATVIYATHSHHLIDPRWLDNTFIVTNEALSHHSYDNYVASMANIRMEKYRNFVGQYPEKSTYFQPVLDVLEYSPSNLEMVPSIVMVEGKNDFYTLELFQFLANRKNRLNFLPGGGSSGLDTPIKLYTAWNKPFCILLDSDKEGSGQKKRYTEKYDYIVYNKVFTLSDIDPTWQGYEMEDLISHVDKSSLCKVPMSSVANLTKKQINMAIQEFLASEQTINLSPETRENFEKVFNYLEAKVAWVEKVRKTRAQT